VFIRTFPQIVLCLLATVLVAFGQSTLPPVAYYDSAIGPTGAALKAALKQVIDGHTVLPYTATGTDTWDALKVLDEDPANAANVLMIYSGYSVAKTEQWTGSTGIWDREHLWPQSYGLVVLNADSRARRDIFNLLPVDVNVNSSRGNKYYDETTPPGSSYPDAPESSYDSDSWEPRTADKGPIARALFYMAVRYDGTDPDVPDLELRRFPIRRWRVSASSRRCSPGIASMR
jgi:endonuclease I